LTVIGDSAGKSQQINTSSYWIQLFLFLLFLGGNLCAAASSKYKPTW
jgi:hypothetical protein